MPSLASFLLGAMRCPCSCCGANICGTKYSFDRCPGVVDETCITCVGTNVRCFSCSCRACAVRRAGCGELAVLPDQAAAPSASGAPCLVVLSLVCDTLEFNYRTKLSHQTVHALSAKLC